MDRQRQQCHKCYQNNQCKNCKYIINFGNATQPDKIVRRYDGNNCA